MATSMLLLDFGCRGNMSDIPVKTINKQPLSLVNSMDNSEI